MMPLRLSIAWFTSCVVCVAVFAQSPEAADAPAAEEQAYQGEKENLHIYLLIGQSNMAGRAAISEDEQAPIERAYLLNAENTWQAAANPLNQFSTIRKGIGIQKLSPGYTFALSMLEHDTESSIGLVVNARGGSKIEQWAKGTKYYTDAVERLRAAAQTGTIKGVLWHQGESNAKEHEDYLEKLQDLVENLREDLEMPELPFVAGQISNSPAMNEQIAKLPEVVSNTAFVSSQDLTTTDRWHFDAPSIRELGRRYAAAMIDLQHLTEAESE